MIDTHSHLLPGLDHGCPDLATSVQMAAAAAAAGVTTVICTPHLTEWDEDLLRRARSTIATVRNELASAGIALELRLGFEVDLSVVVAASQQMLSSLVVEGTSGLLILETPYYGWPLHLEETVFRLSAGRLVPVLAHPERNERVQESPDVLTGCLRAGAVLQGTAGSLGGPFGKEATRSLHRLLEAGMIRLLASDAHSFRAEDWTMERMIRLLEGRLSHDDLLILTEVNPARLLAGQSMLPVMAEESGGRWWKRARRDS